MKLENTEDTELSESITEQLDKEHYSSVEDIGESIFKVAISEKRRTYLLGNNIIAMESDPKEQIKIEKELSKLNTKLLIPVIAVVIRLINSQKTTQE